MTVATAMEKKSMSDFVSGLFVSCPSEMLISDGHWGVYKHAAYLGSLKQVPGGFVGMGRLCQRMSGQKVPWNPKPRQVEPSHVYSRLS